MEFPNHKRGFLCRRGAPVVSSAKSPICRRRRCKVAGRLRGQVAERLRGRSGGAGGSADVADGGEGVLPADGDGVKVCCGERGCRDGDTDGEGVNWDAWDEVGEARRCSGVVGTDGRFGSVVGLLLYKRAASLASRSSRASGGRFRLLSADSCCWPCCSLMLCAVRWCRGTQGDGVASFMSGAWSSGNLGISVLISGSRRPSAPMSLALSCAARAQRSAKSRSS